MPIEGSLVLRAWLSLPRPYVPPRNPIEEALAAIWAEALNVDCVGVDDDFADLGGDSFDAATVLSMVESELGVHAQLSTLVDASTVAALAQAVQRMRASDPMTTLRR